MTYLLKAVARVSVHLQFIARIPQKIFGSCCIRQVNFVVISLIRSYPSSPKILEWRMSWPVERSITARLQNVSSDGTTYERGEVRRLWRIDRSQAALRVGKARSL